MKIGIFGGTFDPFHAGHYAIVMESLNFVDKVIVVPSIVSYYRNKNNGMFSHDERKRIIEYWFKDRNDIILDFNEYEANFSETDLKTRRYWHMFRDIKRKYGEEHEYVTIVGSDSWNNLDTWFNYDELLRDSKFLVVRRVENTLKVYDTEFKSNIFPDFITTIGGKFKNVSATSIRNQFLADYTIDETMRLEKYLKMVDIALGNDKDESEKYVEKETLIAKTPIFNLVSVHKDSYDFDPVRIKSKNWVSVAVVSKGKILTVRQLRYGIDLDMTELPCGMIEDGEEPFEAAARELLEETGYGIKPEHLEYLGSDYANPAFMNNVMHYIYVNLDKLDLYSTGNANPDEHEKLIVEWVDLEKFMNCVEKRSVFMTAAVSRLKPIVEKLTVEKCEN